MSKDSDTIDEVLQTVRIAAAHHRELVELAVDEGFDVAAQIQDAGDVLDVAIVLAYLDGARAFDLWRASGLPVRYVTALTSGSL
jgi:hypothetical protein